MTKTKIAFVLFAFFAGAFTFSQYVSFIGSTEELCKRYPDIDPSIVWAVHKRIYKEVLMGKHSEAVDATEPDGFGPLDDLFLARVQEYQK